MIKQLSPIVSLSLNPAIDLTYEIHHLQHDQKTRAQSTRYDPGGTGINVGRALDRLNAKATTCCITAGTMGQHLEHMLQQHLKHYISIQVPGETRINTTIVQHSPPQQYEINATGSSVTQQQIEPLIQQFLHHCGTGIGILTGSLPPGIADNTYHHINQALQQQHARAIIDAPVAILKHTLRGKPFAIKPNLHELQILCQKSLNSLSEIAYEAQQLARDGIHYVCISLGEQGAILATTTTCWYANTPTIQCASSVGAGDSMVAALAYAFSCQLSPEQALKLACACGAHTAQQPGTELFNVAEVERLLPQIQVVTIHPEQHKKF